MSGVTPEGALNSLLAFFTITFDMFVKFRINGDLLK